MNFLRPLVFLLAWLLAVSLAWLLLPPALPSGLSLKSVDNPWQLEPPFKSDVDAQLALIQSSQLWPAPPSPAGLLPPVAEPPLTPPDWRIDGVYMADGQSVVMVAQSGAPDRVLNKGDLLPGGAKILGISPDRLFILLNGKRLALSTHPE